MFPNENGIQAVSSAVLHSVRTPVFILAGIFVLIVAVTVVLAVREIKNDP